MEHNDSIFLPQQRKVLYMQLIGILTPHSFVLSMDVSWATRFVWSVQNIFTHIYAVSNRTGFVMHTNHEIYLKCED